MKLLKSHKIRPVHVLPGDTLNLHYSYEEEDGTLQCKVLKVDTFDEPMTVDTVIAYKTETGEYGLKAGRALILGEAECST